MRFITEFELPEYYDKSNEAWGSFNLERKKTNLECGMGVGIASSFGWENPVNGNDLHYRLEIEAFPMDKWVEFKNKLLFEIQESAIHGIPISPIRTLELIKDLEFYSNNKQAVDTLIGKPSGDAITNLPDLEYRGSSSHCKACEDEKAGIKHIQAQRHTCGK